MLEFPCKCGERFSLPEDEGGTSMQCPRCRVLVVVPTADELAVMDGEGLYQFDPSGPAGEDVRYADLHRFFTRATVDADGNERDLRRRVDEYELVETEPVRVSPRYDPETGELIRAIPLNEPPMAVIALDEDGKPPAPVIAIAAGGRSLSYAAGETARRTTAFTMLLEAVGPGNVAVLIAVFFGYLCARMTTAVAELYAAHFLQRTWPLLIVNLPMWLIVSHLGVVVEETGLNDTDDLPRPLRNLELGEDIFGPMFKVIMAGLICYLPALVSCIVTNYHSPQGVVLVAGLFAMGSVPFPAVLLTTVTGATISNLRPDRVIGVMSKCGGRYAMAILLGCVAVGVTAFYTAVDLLAPQADPVSYIRLLRSPPVTMMGLAAGVISLHLFGRYMGQLFRDHHEEFNWVGMRHTKVEVTPRRQFRIGKS